MLRRQRVSNYPSEGKIHAEIIRIGFDLSKSIFVLNGVDQQEHCQLKRIEVAAVILQETAMSYYRTAKHRALRAELIHRWKPWTQLTGLKTDEGKARSAMRGYKGEERLVLRQLRQVMSDDVIN